MSQLIAMYVQVWEPGLGCLFYRLPGYYNKDLTVTRHHMQEKGPENAKYNQNKKLVVETATGLKLKSPALGMTFSSFDDSMW